MAADAHFVFIEDPRALAQFYTETLHLAAPRETTVNSRLSLTFAYDGGELIVRASHMPKIPPVSGALIYRLPASVPVDAVAGALVAQGRKTGEGVNLSGIAYVDGTDPVGLPWRILSHS